MDALFPLQLLFEVLHRPFSAIVPPPTVYEAFWSIYFYRNNNSTEVKSDLTPEIHWLMSHCLFLAPSGFCMLLLLFSRIACHLPPLLPWNYNLERHGINRISLMWKASGSYYKLPCLILLLRRSWMTPSVFTRDRRSEKACREWELAGTQSSRGHPSSPAITVGPLISPMAHFNHGR